MEWTRRQMRRTQRRLTAQTKDQLWQGYTELGTMKYDAEHRYRPIDAERNDIWPPFSVLRLYT